MPTIPASAPDKAIVSTICFRTLTPPYSAAEGFEPTARTSYPHFVRHKNTQTKNAARRAFLVWVFLWRTKWGYEVRAVGSNPSAAEYGGVSVRKQIVLTMALSGALAGMVGVNDVLGYHYRYYHDFSPFYGFSGIAVALLGRNHPLGVALAALLIGALNRGGLFVDIFTDKVSKDLVQVLQAIIILLVAMEALFRGRLARFIK